MANYIGHFYNAESSRKSWHSRLSIQLIVFICATTLPGTNFAGDNTNNTEYNLKAAYLYQFTKFTQWPGRLFINQNSPIKICILGKNPFGKSLDSFSSRASQGRDLSIKYLSSLQNIASCHVVFICRSEDRKLPQILLRIENSPVLSVSDIDNFAQRGGIIGFVPRQRKVGLEINVAASHTSGTKISSKLLGVATLIRSQTP